MKRRMPRIHWSLFFLVVIQISSTTAQEEGDGQSYLRVKPKSGERCIICDMPLATEDVTLIVKGRRVPLKHAMVDSFMNNQEKFFAGLQPRGALFQENMDAPAGVAQGGVSSAWFNFGLYMLIGLLFGGLSAYWAIAKGLPAMPYFFAGLLVNVFGFVFVLTRPAKSKDVPKGLVKVPDTHAPVACPKCGAANHPSASACTGCGAQLTPVYESEVSKT